MDMSLLDALLGFALTYSTTYVLYCWVHDDKPARDGRPASAGGQVHAAASEVSPDHSSRPSSTV